MRGIELTQANLSKRDLLEGHWEYIAEANTCVPRTWEGSTHSCHFSLGPHGLPSLPLSQYGVHSSSSLWTKRITSLIHSHAPNVAGCLNPYLTEPYKSSACNSLTGILVPPSWERVSGGSQWESAVARGWVGFFGLSPPSSSYGGR